MEAGATVPRLRAGTDGADSAFVSQAKSRDMPGLWPLRDREKASTVPVQYTGAGAGTVALTSFHWVDWVVQYCDSIRGRVQYI